MKSNVLVLIPVASPVKHQRNTWICMIGKLWGTLVLLQNTQTQTTAEIDYNNRGDWLNIISVMIHIKFYHVWVAAELQLVIEKQTQGDKMLDKSRASEIFFDCLLWLVHNPHEQSYKNNWPVELSSRINITPHSSLIGEINLERFDAGVMHAFRCPLLTMLCQVEFSQGRGWPLKVKRSTKFEKTMSLGVNVIRVINDIQPFSDDERSQVGIMWNMHVV